MTRGMPPHEPTQESRAEVKALAAYGISHEQIGQYIGIDPKTLRKHYRADLDEAVTKAHAAVGKYLYSAASGAALSKGASHSDCIRAAMFYAKTQMNWRETEHENDKTSQPIQITFTEAKPDADSTA